MDVAAVPIKPGENLSVHGLRKRKKLHTVLFPRFSCFRVSFSQSLFLPVPSLCAFVFISSPPLLASPHFHHGAGVMSSSQRDDVALNGL